MAAVTKNGVFIFTPIFFYKYIFFFSNIGKGITISVKKSFNSKQFYGKAIFSEVGVKQMPTTQYSNREGEDRLCLLSLSNFQDRTVQFARKRLGWFVCLFFLLSAFLILAYSD